MNEELILQLEKHLSKQIVYFLRCRFPERLEIDNILKLSEDELLASWLSMKSVIELVKFQEFVKTGKIILT